MEQNASASSLNKSTNKPIELVIFDCDGTLVDSEPLVAEVVSECAAEHGIAITADEVHRRFKGGRLADCVLYLETLRGGPLPASFVDQIREREGMALREKLRPMEGAVELLKAMHLPYCMASNGPRSKMDITLGTTNLMQYFEDRIFSAYEVGSWKPEPGLFLHAAEKFGVEPDRCAVIEDSMPGIVAGVAAGMRVFALDPDQHMASEVPEGVRVIRSLHELHHHLIAKPTVVR